MDFVLTKLDEFGLTPLQGFAIVLVVVYLMSILWPRPAGSPPYERSLLPYLGSVVPFAISPVNLITNLRKKHGDIFTVKLFGQYMTILTGPEANSVFFKANDSQLSPQEPYEFTRPVFGEGVVYDAPPEIFHQQLKFLRNGLTKEKLSGYADIIIKEVQIFAEERFGKEGEINFHDAMGELTISTAASCLLGPEIRESMNERGKFAELYHSLEAAMNPIGVFYPNMPFLPGKTERDNAREELGKLFAGVIKNRRETNYVGEDLLQFFMDAAYKDGRQLTDHEIAGMLIAGLFAGQHTSSITSNWAALLIMTHKSVLEEVMAEQKAVLEEYGEELTYNALDDMTVLHMCVKETLRMYPPLIMLMRYTKEERPYKDYVIPQGTLVAVSPKVSHRLPEVFKNPDEFNPHRFIGEDAEDKKARYSFIGFGGGRHGCLGEQFAYVQIKTILSTLFRMYDFEFVGDELPPPDYNHMVVGPSKPCMVRYKRKEEDL